MVARRLVALSFCLALGACATQSTTPGGSRAVFGAASHAHGAASTGNTGHTSGPAPGQWQLVIEIIDMPGGKKIPPQTLSMCSSVEDKLQWQEMVGGRVSGACKVKDYTATGSTIHYALQCGDSIEGATTITVIDEDNYRGESTLMMRSLAISGSNSGAGSEAVIKSRITGSRVAKTCGK
jgi:hypothetical protein